MTTPKGKNFQQIEVDGIQYYLPVSDQLYKNEPELKTPDKGDWYVYYHIWDFTNGGWLPQKYYSDFLNKKNIITNLKQRKSNGETVRATVYNTLKEGINPKTGITISPFVNKTIEQVLNEAKDDSPVPTVRDAISKWLLMKAGKDNPGREAPENKENTANTYKYFFATFLKYCEKHLIDGVKLDKIKRHVVYEFFEQRYNAKKKPIGDLTWNVQLGYLKGMFSYFAKVYDFKDPIVHLEDKEVLEDSERFDPFTKEQVKLIFDHLDSSYMVKYSKYVKEAPADKLLALVSRTIYYSFMRPSELVRIKIKNVKRYKEGFLTLSTGITKTKKKVFNELYIDPALVAEYAKLGWEQYFDDPKYDNYYVFTKDLVPSLVKVDSSDLSRSFKNALVRIGLYVANKYSLYSLKASGNIDAFESGWDLFQISIQNRHTTVTQTEVYLRKLKCNIAERPRPERNKL